MKHYSESLGKRSRLSMTHGEHLLKSLQQDFIGLDTSYRLADGQTRRRVYLDSAATSLMLGIAQQTTAAFLRHNANSHSRIHFAAHTATESHAFAREQVLAFVGADPEQYLCLFVGSGATAALNRAAGYLRGCRPQADTVLVSLMEHHSNDLPHRRPGRVKHIPLLGAPPALGAIDVSAFVQLLRGEAVRYAAVSMVSNVTGILNPTARLVEAARAEGVPILVAASQAIAAHEQVLTERLVDALLAVPGLRLYGPPDPARWPRVGVATFNLAGLDHGFVAAVLNDYYNIAVRNQCFCAQPYAQALLSPELWSLQVTDDPVQAEQEVRRWRGMVRASLALHSTPDDIDLLASALSEIRADAGRYRPLYRMDDDGEYRHVHFVPAGAFAIPDEVDRLLDSCSRKTPLAAGCRRTRSREGRRKPGTPPGGEVP